MKKFVPHTYDHSIWKEILFTLIIGFSFITVFGFLANDYDLISDLKTLPFLVLIFSSVLIPCWAIIKYEMTTGLFINGEELLYRHFRKKFLNPQDIIAIKITRAAVGYRFSPIDFLKDNDGNQLYSMFLLKNYMPWAMNEKEGQEMTCDMEFSTWGREYIICRLVYDQEAIDHLLRLNPNIVVF